MTDAEITLSNLDPYYGDTRTSAERNFGVNEYLPIYRYDPLD